jgi:hypothetical protein
LTVVVSCCELLGCPVVGSGHCVTPTMSLLSMPDTFPPPDCVTPYT